MMPMCRDISRWVAADEVERLPIAKRLLLTLHLSMCGRCARFARELRRIGEAARMRWNITAEDHEVIARLERSILENIGDATDGRNDAGR
jgi:hypothetical protein